MMEFAQLFRNVHLTFYAGFSDEKASKNIFVSVIFAFWKINFEHFASSEFYSCLKKRFVIIP